MATNELSAAQQMSELAAAERKKAFARNEYNPAKTMLDMMLIILTQILMGTVKVEGLPLF